MSNQFIIVTKEEVEFDSTGRAVIKNDKANKLIKETLEEVGAIVISSSENVARAGINISKCVENNTGCQTNIYCPKT